MSYEVHDRELDTVTSLSGPERFEYFINKVSYWEEVWSLYDGDGWALCSDGVGGQLIPVWPAKAFASVCCSNDWSGYEPRAISLEDWLAKWTPGMASDNRKVALFPTQTDVGLVLEPVRLASEIREAMDAYE